MEFCHPAPVLLGASRPAGHHPPKLRARSPPPIIIIIIIVIIIIGLHHLGHKNPDDWDSFNVPPLHWAHAGGRLEYVVKGWAKEVHIHFNDEQRNMSNPDHKEVGWNMGINTIQISCNTM